MTDRHTFPTSRAARLFYGAIAMVPLAMGVGAAYILAGKVERVLAAPLVPSLVMGFCLALMGLVLWRVFDRVEVVGTRLRVRVFRWTQFDLAQDVVFWGRTSQTRQGGNRTLLVFQTEAGQRIVPLANLERSVDLVGHVRRICGEPTPVHRTGAGYTFMP